MHRKFDVTENLFLHSVFFNGTKPSAFFACTVVLTRQVTSGLGCFAQRNFRRLIGRTESPPRPTSSDTTPPKRTIHLQPSGAFDANQTRPRPTRRHGLLLQTPRPNRHGNRTTTAPAAPGRQAPAPPRPSRQAHHPPPPPGHHPTAASRGSGALRPDVTGGDEGRIQTGPGRPVPPRCLRDLRPVHRRFALSICLLPVGFGAVAVEGYGEI
jgi:hypothetical protein